MKVIVAGGDGFCGWPTALHLSACGHEVIVADNLSRRGIDQELGTNSLTPITTLETRAALWSELTGHHLSVAIGDLTDAQFVHELFARFEPDGVVHFAEQRSAPYSMIDRQHAVSTQVNNVVGTLNLLFAIHAFGGECHLVKLGTMGEYGTPNIDIEEGYLEIEHNGRRDTLPYPKSVLQLAERVSRVAIALGLDAPIEHLANPRVESESHYYRARSSKLLDLGLEPHLLDDTTVAGLIEVAIRHRDRIRPDTIAAHADWRAVPYWDAQRADAGQNGDKDGHGGERLSRGSPSRHA